MHCDDWKWRGGAIFKCQGSVTIDQHCMTLTLDAAAAGDARCVHTLNDEIPLVEMNFCFYSSFAVNQKHDILSLYHQVLPMK